MGIIIDKSEFDEMKPWDKLFVISTDGSINSYRFACKHPKIKDRIILVHNSDYAQVSSMSTDLDTGKVFLSTYNSYEVGEIMISQLEKKIEHIKQVYIEDADNF